MMHCKIEMSFLKINLSDFCYKWDIKVGMARCILKAYYPYIYVCLNLRQHFLCIDAAKNIFTNI